MRLFVLFIVVKSISKLTKQFLISGFSWIAFSTMSRSDIVSIGNLMSSGSLGTLDVASDANRDTIESNVSSLASIFVNFVTQKVSRAARIERNTER